MTDDLDDDDIAESVRPIRAILRGLQTLVALNLNNGASVSQIAQVTRIPRTTVYRILETLASAGFVMRDPVDERYRLTIQVRSLADGFDDEAWVMQIASPKVRGLAKDVIWPITISTLYGTRMLVRETTDHDSPLALERYSAGLRVPILASASGRVYLAYCSQEQRETLLDILAKSPDFDDAIARNRTFVNRLLNEIRTNGYAIVNRPMSNETTMAVPIMAGDRIIACMAMRFIQSAVTDREVVDKFHGKMLACARSIGDTFMAS